DAPASDAARRGREQPHHDARRRRPDEERQPRRRDAALRARPNDPWPSDAFGQATPAAQHSFFASAALLADDGPARHAASDAASGWMLRAELSRDHRRYFSRGLSESARTPWPTSASARRPR